MMSSKGEGRTLSCTDNDLYHYTKMVDYFQNKINDPKQAEEWKYKALNRLMQLLECTEDEKFVQNSLIVLMAMTEDLPSDIYNSRGTHVTRLSVEEKEIYMSILKQEFLNPILIVN